MALATRRVRRNRSVGNKLNDIESRVVAAEKKTIQESSIGSTQIATEGVAKENVKDRAIASEKIEIGAINTEHLGQVNGISSGGDFAINVGEEGHVTLNGTLYTTPYDSLTDTSDLYTLGFDPTSSKVVVYPDVPVTALTQASQNYLINGGFDFWQRGTSFTGTNVYCADRWLQTRSANIGLTVAQSTDIPTGQPLEYSALMTTSSNNTFAQLEQRIESDLGYQLAGRTVTFSIWAKSGSGTPSNSTLTWSTAYPTASDDWTTPISDQSGTFAATFTNGTWVRYSATFTVNALATRGYRILVKRTLTTAQTTTTFLSGAQLELGSVATPFRRSGSTYTEEQLACFRYYQLHDTIFGTSDGTYKFGTNPAGYLLRTTPTSVVVATISAPFSGTVLGTSVTMTRTNKAGFYSTSGSLGSGGWVNFAGVAVTAEL
jgi:hypothetical protein